MICSIFGVISPQFLCQGNPTAVMISEIFLIVISVITIVWVFSRAPSILAKIGGIFVILVSLLLGISVSKLVWLENEKSEDTKGMIVILIDNSESVHRQGTEKYRAALSYLADKLEYSISNLTQDQTSDWEGVVYSFASDVEKLHQISDVATLPEVVRNVEFNLIGNDTNISVALKKSIDEFKESSKNGQIWMLTDGNSTKGEVDEIINQLQEKAIPVNVLGYDSGRPSKGLWSADIANEQSAEQLSILRSNVFGGGKLALEINGKHGGEPTIIPDSENLQPLRHEILFENRGINSVELILEGSNENFTQNERLYTLVKGPAQILSFGDSKWLEGINREKYFVTIGNPVSPQDARNFDAVVINGLEPTAFPENYTEILLKAINQGVGVFIANGPLRGGLEMPQLIADWEESEIGPILPVNSDPMDYIAEPPPRDVLVIIDTSGSMAGDPLYTAQSGIHAILDNLRPLDTVLIQPYASGASAAFGPVKATQSNVAAARSFTDNLRAGGASNLDAAVSIVSQWKSNHCGVFILSDGYVEEVDPNRLCFPTAIGVADFTIPGFENHGQSYTASSGERLKNIKFEFFKPEIRDKFWREDRITPYILDNWAELTSAPIIDGIALTYARADSFITMVPTTGAPDPVLVFRRDPIKINVRTGVFLGELTARWNGHPATDAILNEMIGWKDPNRFTISFKQSGHIINSKVTTLGENPPPSHLEMQFFQSDDTVLQFQTAPTRWPGVFEGTLELPISLEIQKGTLILKPRGEPMQEIPMTLPPNQSEEVSLNLAESLTYGINNDLLSEIKKSTGGLDISDEIPQITKRKPYRNEIPIWPYTLVIALSLFAASLYTGGNKR